MYVYICIHLEINEYLYTHYKTLFIHTHMCVYMYIYICACVCVSVCVRV